MARSGTVSLNNLVVKVVHHQKTGSQIVAATANGAITVTIAIATVFPDDLNVRPDGTIDMKLDYDPR